jgi:hypothetical protein
MLIYIDDYHPQFSWLPTYYVANYERVTCQSINQAAQIQSKGSTSSRLHEQVHCDVYMEKHLWERIMKAFLLLKNNIQINTQFIGD